MNKYVVLEKSTCHKTGEYFLYSKELDKIDKLNPNEIFGYPELVEKITFSDTPMKKINVSYILKNNIEFLIDDEIKNFTEKDYCLITEYLNNNNLLDLDYFLFYLYKHGNKDISIDKWNGLKFN